MPPRSPKPWYGKGLSFGCTQCGNCCTNRGAYAFVLLTEPDIAAITAFLKIGRREFLERYCTDAVGKVTLRTDSPACAFLREDHRCAIYSARPKQCATWPFWRENLEKAVWEEEVARVCPGIGKGRLHGAEEIERIAREDAGWYGLE